MANVAKINGYDVKDAEARGDIADIQQALSTAQGDITTLQDDVLNTEADLGDITALTTTVKTSAVNAINEVKDKVDDNTVDIGNLTRLNTVDKTDLVSAINEVGRNASYGISKNTYNFAPTFSDETSYEVGDYVTYNGVLYKCTTAHSAGAWVAGHFTQVTVGGTFTSVNKKTWQDKGYVSNSSLTFNLPNIGLYLFSIDSHGYDSKVALYIVAIFGDTCTAHKIMDEYDSIQITRDPTAGTITVATANHIGISVNIQYIGEYN